MNRGCQSRWRTIFPAALTVDRCRASASAKLAARHSRTVPPVLTETRRLPSAENARPGMPCVRGWSLRVATSRPVVRFHSFTVESPLADPSVFPSAEKATASTLD